MKCQACRKPLTNEVSKRYGFGPSCLKKAVAAGNAPLESLTEMTVFKKSAAKSRKEKQAAPERIRCESTLDLFDALKYAALDDLNNAVNACRNIGIEVTVTIGEP
mgnify:CR=1 FL=1